MIYLNALGSNFVLLIIKDMIWLWDKVHVFILHNIMYLVIGFEKTLY